MFPCSTICNNFMLPGSKLHTWLTLIAIALVPILLSTFKSILKFSRTVVPPFFEPALFFPLSSHLLVVILSPKANPSSVCACHTPAPVAKSPSFITSLKGTFLEYIPCGILPSVNIFILGVLEWHCYFYKLFEIVNQLSYTIPVQYFSLCVRHSKTICIVF